MTGSEVSVVLTRQERNSPGRHGHAVALNPDSPSATRAEAVKQGIRSRMAAKDAVPTVPQRNDPKPLEPYRKSRSTEIAAQRPGFQYQWMRPEDVEWKSRPHEIGNKHVGYFEVGGWEVVRKNEIKTPGPGMPSAGTPVDTTVTNGELILMCLPDAEHIKYAEMERLNDELIDKRLTTGESHSFGNTSFKTRTTGGKASLDANVNKILEGVA